MLDLDKIELQGAFGPLDHNELQRRAGTPEQRRHRQRDLAQAVPPQQPGSD
jgi:hypothetical protein